MSIRTAMSIRARGSPVSITTRGTHAEMFGGGTATAQYQLGADGVLRVTLGSNSLVAVPGEWLVFGSASLYQARLSLVSSTGNPLTHSGEPLGVWVDLGVVNRSWAFSSTGPGVGTAHCTADIRRVSDMVVVDTASIVFTAEAS